MTIHLSDPNHPAYSRALEELRPELEAIPHHQLETIRLDIGSVHVQMRPVVARVEAFRDQIAAELGEDVAVHVDRLQKTARACFQAHALHLTKAHGRNVEELIEKLGQTRRVLLLEAEGLVARKLFPASSLAELVGGTGYKAMCLDVVQLVAAFRSEWAAIASETPVTALELDQAEALADAAALALGESEQVPSSPETVDLRQRAYTLFVRTYDEVRRAMTYLRWDEDDVDEIVPSLFAGRKGKSDKGEDDDGHDEIHGASDRSSPSPTNGAAPVAPGHPGGSPFVS
jgi:hypothetical protein